MQVAVSTTFAFSKITVKTKEYGCRRLVDSRLIFD